MGRFSTRRGCQPCHRDIISSRLLSPCASFQQEASNCPPEKVTFGCSTMHQQECDADYGRRVAEGLAAARGAAATANGMPATSQRMLAGAMR